MTSTFHGILICALLTCGASLYAQDATEKPPAKPAAAPATDDDSDGPVPVVVKPKRPSIHARGLRRLIVLTENNSPNLQRAQAEMTVAKLNYSIEGKRWFPSFDIKVQHGHGVDGQDVTNPSPWAQTVSLTLNENLYDNGQSITKYHIARTVLDKITLEYEIARDKHLLNVANAYFEWSAATQQVEILGNKRELLRRQHAVLETLYKHGIKTKRDVLRIETEIRRNELDLINAENEVDLSFQKLSSLVGLSRQDLEKEEIEADEPKPFVKLDGLADIVKPRDHRQAKVLEFRKREAELATRLVNRDYWPQVWVSGGYSYNNLYYINPTNDAAWDKSHTWGWTGLVTLQYNIWDWGIRRQQVEIARVREKQVGDANEQELLDLGNELRDVINKLRAFRESVRMTRELLVMEQQSYAILEAEYRNGRAQYLDVILNLNSWIDARSKFNASYYGLKKQQLLYSFHQGDLYAYLK